MKRRHQSIITLAIIYLVLVFVFPLTVQAKDTIIDEWGSVKAPAAPELKQVTVDPKFTAILVLDIQNNNCNAKRRPRCVESIPKIKGLLDKARSKEMAVLYSVTSSRTEDDIREEVFPSDTSESVVKASVDKFYGTALARLLKEKGIKTVIIVGTSAHGAVLATATGAAMRKLKIIVPVDGISSSKAYAEQYTAWHLANSPGTRKRTTLTRINMINF